MPEVVVEVVGTETEKTPLVVVMMALEGMVVVVVVVVKPSDVAGLPSSPTFGQFVESILNCDRKSSRGRSGFRAVKETSVFCLRCVFFRRF